MRLTVTRDGLLAQDVMRPPPLPSDPCDLRALPIETAIDFLKYTEEDSQEVCQKLGRAMADAVATRDDWGAFWAEWGAGSAEDRQRQLLKNHIKTRTAPRDIAIAWAWYWAIDPTPRCAITHCFIAARAAGLTLEKAKELFDEAVGL